LDEVAQVWGFFCLFNYIIPEALPPLLMGSALPSGGSILEPGGTGSVSHGGNFWQFLTEASPVPSFYQNVATQIQYRSSELDSAL